MTDAPELWDLCAEQLQDLVGLANWKTWFDQLQPVGLDDRLLSLSAPSTVVREKLEERYLPTMQELASKCASRPIMVHISVGPAASTEDPDAVEVGAAADETALGMPSHPDLWGSGDPRPEPADNPTGALVHRPVKTGDNATLSDILPALGPPQLNPRYTFEAFVIGGSNSFAHAAAQRVAEKPAESYNPLFIHGASGLGKTHLLHAIGHYVAANFSSKVVRYVSTETFLNEFVDAIRTNGQTAFKRRYRECDVLLIDDVQFIEGKEGLQQEFFHTFNALHDKSKQIVLSSDRPPRSIATLEDRMRSRFEWGLIIDVVPPDLETRLAILRKKAETEHTPIPADVLELIATHVKDNIRELEGALIRVCAYASLNHQTITLQMAERVLSDILDVNRPKQITARRIIDCTAEMFELDSEELRGPKRHRQLVHARQICMYSFRELTQYSYPQIGREFSNRDHTTVMYAVDKVSKHMKERQQVYDEVTELIQRIKGTN